MQLNKYLNVLHMIFTFFLFNNLWPHAVKYEDEVFTYRDLPTQLFNSFLTTRCMKFYHLRFEKVDETTLRVAAGYRGHL